MRETEDSGEIAEEMRTGERGGYGPMGLSVFTGFGMGRKNWGKKK